MKKQAGFTMVEFIIAMGITLVVIGITLVAFSDATRSNERVTLRSEMNDNLRASMNMVRQDLIVAAQGIPPGGIPIPTAPGVSINRPNLTPLTFAGPMLPAISLGTGLGPAVKVLVSTTAPAPSGTPTDITTILYTDNTLGLGQTPINLPPGPGVTTPCNGTIAADGSNIVFDTACLNLATAKFTINSGDLILFSNVNNSAIQTVTSVAGQKVNFAKDSSKDKFGFNGTNAPQGTIIQLQNPIVPPTTPATYDGTYPPTTATRLWMTTYYLDDQTDPVHVRLVRRINFNAAQPVGEVIENLTIRYNFVDGNSPPKQFFADSSTVPPGLSESLIRSVNLFLAARSNTAYSKTGTYFRDNLTTQVSIRSLSYYDHYK
ncbi:MAG TPA: prepilin-type N-terminal cleavage/methylation domain-containing protein [Candidatus Dormibacteraeota bacterium]|nr:prepilin-type N-terminal cleavage/methylation domain-containing protein [Candidatus Dormibacteraeota bacterium]